MITGWVQIDIDDRGSPFHKMKGDIIIGGDSPRTANKNNKVRGVLQEVFEIFFLFRVPGIFAIPKHQYMWAGNSSTALAYRVVGGFHGNRIQIT